jgi:hypothetical protein
MFLQFGDEFGENLIVVRLEALQFGKHRNKETLEGEGEGKCMIRLLY